MASANGNVQRVPISRGASSQHGRTASRMSCNRCRKPLNTTVFVCSCDCVFCEDCTYSHFNDSSTCPQCGKTLEANDFIELVVADPSSVTDSLKTTFQTIFTKYDNNGDALSHQEMCSRLLKSVDDDRRAIRFLLKQIARECSVTGQQSGNVGRAYEKLQKEYTQLKKAASAQRMQLEQMIEDLKHRVQALTVNLQEQQKKIDEQNSQLRHFRQLYASDGLVPSSSHSDSGSAGGNHRAVPRTPSSGGRGPAVPPMQEFVFQKQARERANRQAVTEITRTRVPTSVRASHSMSDVDSIITPVQVPPPSSHRQKNPYHSATAGPGYVFTSRSRDNLDSNKRQRLDTISPMQDYGYPRQSRPPTSSQGGMGPLFGHRR